MKSKTELTIVILRTLDLHNSYPLVRRKTTELWNNASVEKETTTHLEGKELSILFLLHNYVCFKLNVLGLMSIVRLFQTTDICIHLNFLSLLHYFVRILNLKTF